MENNHNEGMSGFLAIEQKLAVSTRRHRGFPRDQAMLVRMVKLLHKLFSDHANLLLRQHGLTHPEYNVLMMLDGSAGGLSPSQLAEATSEKSSNTTRLIDQLLAKGLLTRSPSDEDRRKLLVQLTDEGEALIRQVVPAVTLQLQGFFAGITDAQRSQLEHLLKKVLRGVESQG
ncbi:MarR family transcriptional regulator [Rhodanobacter thiooxydans]|uniref:MarR family transcriptional regulator n=2 Tax=Rhodanobacter thiooxydans TaxID=416169 RepID=A0A154QIG3_9GAMM|nr:MarR family transcriptional regulator [Rhodanobacter thiooxydans]